MIDRGWSQIGFARIAELLTERAGLTFSPSRRAGAEEAMARVMRQQGVSDPGSFADRLQQDERALDALIADVTIGETYFFREPAQLEYIRRSVLPALRNTPDGRPMRIWSAGCATGEEPYTLAIMLREDQPASSARIVGTEVSRPRLDAARRARYTRWSLRSLAEPVINRYFHQRGSHYLLRPDIRAMVDFGYLNLAGTEYPGGPLDLRGMDLVLCRNVLIYFDRETIVEVAERLLASLSEDGWLFLGASDPPLIDLVPCEVVVTGAGLAYRRVSEKRTRSRAVAAPVSPLATVVTQGLYTTIQESVMDSVAAPDAAGDPHAMSADSWPDVAAPAATSVANPRHDESVATGESSEPAAGVYSAAAAYEARDYQLAAREAASALERGYESAELRVLLVRSLANVGALTEAGEACAAALEAHPTHAELAYLHALLLAESGLVVQAVSAARRALFLDRRLVVAHMLLGGLLARVNDVEGARRSFDNAEKLIESLAPEAMVPASDGEPVRRVREAARVQRDLMSTVP